MQHSTIAAIATAPGAGGIAIVRLSGPESYEVAAKVFRPANPAKKVADAKGYTAMFGAFVEGEEAFDEGVVLFFRAPHSYTGEDVVELSCHGGSAVARRLVEACIAAGAWFNLFCLDICMAGKSGMEFAWELRSWDERAGVFFITTAATHI